MKVPFTAVALISPYCDYRTSSRGLCLKLCNKEAAGFRPKLVSKATFETCYTEVLFYFIALKK